MVNVNQFMVHEESKGRRLDKFLVETLGSSVSRSKIQKEIDEGAWRVDGKMVPAHYYLKAGQIVAGGEAVLRRPSGSSTAVAMNEDVTHTLPVLKIIAETEDYLVVDKPSGIAVHPAPGIAEPTMTDLLTHSYPELRGIGEDPVRPGVVHRIDRLVSGVLVLARNQEAFSHLKQQFQSRKVKKEYAALVYGTFVNDEGSIDLPLVRSAAKGKRGMIQAVPRTGNGREGARDALTRFEVIDRFPRFTLLRVFPETGRTHQIRAHFTAIGHPIAGDPLYRGRAKQKFSCSLARPFLHAASIAFIDREGSEQRHQSELPPELVQELEMLTR